MPLATWRVPNSEFKGRVRDYLVRVVLCSFIVLIFFQMSISILDDDDDDGGDDDDDDPQWTHIPAFAQDDVDFPSCLLTITGESSL